ncbi:MAG: hypothetical protein MJY44_03085 [Bacteroidales bacterium]|nr:hypothetical protein [Bacteroidales bacterium]
MNDTLKYILSTILCAGLLAVLIASFRTGEKQRHGRTCTGAEITFVEDFRFIDEQDVIDGLRSAAGEFIGVRLMDLPLHKMEKAVKAMPHVAGCEVWSTPDCILHVLVDQKDPIAMITDEAGSRYLDAHGKTFPLSSGYTCPTRKVTAGRKMSEAECAELAGFIRNLDKSGAWAERINRISVNGRGEYSFIPDGMKENVHLGSPDNLKTKLAMLDDYCSRISDSTTAYRNVILKYRNQIICRK